MRRHWSCCAVPLVCCRCFPAAHSAVALVQAQHRRTYAARKHCWGCCTHAYWTRWAMVIVARTSQQPLSSCSYDQQFWAARIHVGEQQRPSWRICCSRSHLLQKSVGCQQHSATQNVTDAALHPLPFVAGRLRPSARPADLGKACGGELRANQPLEHPTDAR